MPVIHENFDIYDALEEDVRQIVFAEVNAVDPGLLVLNQNIWIGPVRPVVDSQENAEGVWIMINGGRESMPFLGGSGTEWMPSFQFRIRGGKGNNAYTRGARISRRVFMAADQFPPPAYKEDGTALIPLYTPTTNICDIRCRGSHPIYLGMDSDGFHEWSINAEAVVHGQ